MKLEIYEGPASDRQKGWRHYWALQGGVLRPFLSEPARVAALCSLLALGRSPWAFHPAGSFESLPAVQSEIFAGGAK